MRRFALQSLLVAISFFVTLSSALKAHLRYVTDKRLTSDVNLERYYILEEDLLSNVEALLRDDYFDAADGESETEHQKHKPDLTPIESTINRTKSIHTEAGRDISGFLSHPVNVYHLLRRLNTDWKEGLDVVLKTNLCREWKIPGMVRHLRYIRNRLPGVPELDRVINFLAHQLRLFGPFNQEVKSGKVGDHLPKQPLDVEDQFIIARSLYDQEDYLSALRWLELINDWFTHAEEDKKVDLSFSLTTVLKMMATAYYQVKNPAASVTIVERLLEVDPSNRLAKGNLAFFQNKADEQQEQMMDSKKDTQPSMSKFERFCTRPVIKPSGHRCVHEPHHSTRPTWYFHNKEILRKNPPMFIYHDFISQTMADQLKDYSFNTISDRSWTSDSFRLPRLRLLFQYPFIYPLELRKKARQIVQSLRHLPRPDPLLFKSFGPFQVFTSGLQGMNLTDYTRKLDLVPMKGEKHVGAFFLFLSEAKQGGNVVVKPRKLNFQPSKGSVLFYHTTRSTPHSFCPSIGGSVWAAVQPLYFKDPRQCPPWSRYYR